MRKPVLRIYAKTETQISCAVTLFSAYIALATYIYIAILHKSEMSSVHEQSGLCQSWLETTEYKSSHDATHFEPHR